MAVADEKSTRPQNDEFWRQFSEGLKPELDVDVDGNVDDLVTIYAREWFIATQALTNMISILNKIVERHNILENSIPELPTVIRTIFNSGALILNAERELFLVKTLFFVYEKIREDWGSVEEYANAPEDERIAWHEYYTSQIDELEWPPPSQ